MNLFISSCLICSFGDALITRLKTAGATDTVGGVGGICSEGEEKGFRRRRRCPLCQNGVLLPFCGVAAAAAALSFRRLDSDANTDTDHGNFAGGRVNRTTLTKREETLQKEEEETTSLARSPMLSLSLSFDDELPLAVVIRIAAATTTSAKEEEDNFKFMMFLAMFMKRDQVA